MLAVDVQGLGQCWSRNPGPLLLKMVEGGEKKTSYDILALSVSVRPYFFWAPYLSIASSVLSRWSHLSQESKSGFFGLKDVDFPATMEGEHFFSQMFF